MGMIWLLRGVEPHPPVLPAEAVVVLNTLLTDGVAPSPPELGRAGKSCKEKQELVNRDFISKLAIVM